MRAVPWTLAAFFLVVIAAAGSGQAALDECAAGPVADGLEPSRTGFFREVLFAAATARTPRFDDYTPGSYHVRKLDLAAGLPDAAVECGLKLAALIILGPVNVLWTYHVLAFLHDGDSLRVNALTMPHARITRKVTTRISLAELDSLFGLVSGITAVTTGRPDSAKGGLEGDFSYDLLAVRYAANGPEYWHGSLQSAWDSAPVKAFVGMVNQLLERSLTTYGHIR